MFRRLMFQGVAVVALMAAGLAVQASPARAASIDQVTGVKATQSKADHFGWRGFRWGGYRYGCYRGSYPWCGYSYCYPYYRHCY